MLAVLNQTDIKISSTDNSEMKQFHAHKYWRQVNLDVDRSHRRFPAGKYFILLAIGSAFVNIL